MVLQYSMAALQAFGLAVQLGARWAPSSVTEIHALNGAFQLQFVKYPCKCATG